MADSGGLAKPVGTFDARMMWRALTTNWPAMLAVGYLLCLVVVAATATWLWPFDPMAQLLSSRLLPPLSAADGGGLHLLGTDPLGRDVLTRIVFGVRVSVTVGVLGVLCSAAIGVPLGIIAGYRRGLIDEIVMRSVDVFLAVPSLLVALFVLFLIGGGFVNVVIVFALVRWMTYARLARALTLDLRTAGFVEAALVSGTKTSRIMVRHLLPNMTTPLLVLATLEVALLIIGEASLSFLGFGIQRPGASWGLMIADGREHLRTASWLVMAPGVAILLTTLSLNLVASFLRNTLDPTQSWRWVGAAPQASDT